MILFHGETCVDICVKNTNPYVLLAVEDLRNDFARVSCSGVKPRLVDEESAHCIVIEENTANISDPVEDESFAIKSEADCIRITAGGYLGTMWGIYTFCERYLGVDPCYLFNDLEIQKRETLQVDAIDLADAPKGFRFRGVFINDEDLLTGWKLGGGQRHFDYPFYQRTIVPEVMDLVVETVLRNKMNLVIPATFLDVDNPPEKALADCVAKRGIYLSQHHQEPLGLSHFTLENYCKKHNKTGEFSYIQNPELLEDAWHAYAEMWSEYDNVVWQVGLRGKIDRPVWEEEDPTEKELVDFGAFISNAINRQCRIVKEHTQGKAAHFTSTLWMEGSMLMEKGYLNIDPDVCMVFSDNGPNQMYGNEYHRIPRRSDRKYGIYYHLQYNDLGPHLAPQTGLDKICYNIKKAYDNHDREYLIVNASNIREFTFELDAIAKLLWNTEEFDKDGYITAYCDAVYGNSSREAETCIRGYFDSMPTLPTDQLCNIYAKYFNYFYEEQCPGVKNFLLKEGLILKMGREVIWAFEKEMSLDFIKAIYAEIKSALPRYLELTEQFADLAEKCRDEVKRHTQVKWQLHCITLASIYKWYLCVVEAKLQWDQKDVSSAKISLQKACDALEAYLAARKCAEYGVFANWYREEIEFNAEKCLARTQNRLETSFTQ